MSKFTKFWNSITKNAVDNTTPRNEDYEEEKHIVEEDGKYKLLSRHTGKVLGTHDSKAGAERQEEAIQANKAMINGEEENPYGDDVTEKVEKPGESIHSSKWDDCVRDVQSKNPKANAYAVCTAQLGEEAFKSQYKHLGYVKSQIREARKEMGIGFAGDVPTSLLADQDLEPTADESEEYLRDGEGCEWKQKSSEDAEQKWVLLKRERKELMAEIAAIEKKLEQAQSSTESLESTHSARSKRLKEVNTEISTILDSLKGDI